MPIEEDGGCDDECGSDDVVDDDAPTATARCETASAPEPPSPPKNDESTTTMAWQQQVPTCTDAPAAEAAARGAQAEALAGALLEEAA